MTHLLGSEFCIESLTRDLRDVQMTVDDVTSRVGRVNFQSWKYPHQLAIDVDVSSLLHVCVHDDENTEDNQVAHITLYDLLIDRLLLLLQCFTVFNEKLLVVEDTTTNTNHSMSIGLTTKRCWSRISQISHTLQRLSTAFQSKQQQVGDEDVEIKEINKKQTSDTATNTFTGESPKTYRKFEDHDSSTRKSTSSVDVMNRSAQTLETSFDVEFCEVCTIAQSSLHRVARSIVVVCKSLNLPTSMESYMGRVENQTMSMPEINRWVSLQMKDLSRIERHVRKLMNDVEPLKQEVAQHQLMMEEMKTNEEKLRIQLQDEQVELEENMRRKELKIKQEVKTLQLEVEMSKKCEENLKHLNSNLDDEASDLKSEILQIQRNQFQLVSEREVLKSKLLDDELQKEKLKEKEEQLSELREGMINQKTQIQHLNQKVKTEKMKNAKLSTHQKTLQAKQQALTEKCESLNDECEKVRDENSSLEDEKLQLHDDVTALRHQFDEQKQTLKVLRKEQKAKSDYDVIKTEKTRLERELSDAVERERMLAIFPDMCDRPPPVQGSGDIIEDMRNQVDTNVIRIKLLEDENANLRKALTKLSASGGGRRGAATRSEEEVFNQEPVRLYKDFDFSLTSGQSTALPSFRSDLASSTPRDVTSSTTVTTGRISSASRHHGRPSMYQVPGVVQLPDMTSSSLRKSFTVGPGKRPGSATSSVTSRKPWA